MLAILQAGIAGVDVRRLIGEHLAIENDQVVIGEKSYPLGDIRRISVIGAGKATAGMATAVEQVLSKQIETGIVSGWVNIPEGCEAQCCPDGVPEPSLRVIRQHVARPAGVNEPTEAGVFGTQQMLAHIEKTNDELVQQGIPISQHLVICLMSGGGSALMPLPAEGVTLEQKLAVTRFLSASGATINEINTVRKQLSAVKGGGLKNFCRGTKLVGLILSDVLGDPLDIIASGPTVDNETTAQDAIMVLEKYGFGHRASDFRLQDRSLNVTPEVRSPKSEVYNLIIGNNATAVDAAGLEAVHRGYSPTMLCATQSEGDVEELADYFVDLIRKINDPHTTANLLSDCLISGGEPTVKLVSEAQRGLGGRRHQLELAVICRLFSDETWRHAVRENPNACPFAFLSGGTDGEDGPTDAAGAFFDGKILHQIAGSEIDPGDYLKRNDAYHFFERFDALIKTGPTGTNVCDIRVLLQPLQ